MTSHLAVDEIVALDGIAAKLSQLWFASPFSGQALQGRPTMPSRLRLFFDTIEVARAPGHAQGYELGGNAIALYGATCDQLLSGTVDELRVDYSCRRSIELSQ